MSLIDPNRLSGLQLVPTAIAEYDYTIAIDGMKAGRIMCQRCALGRTWFWTVTGSYLVTAGLPSSGKAETLEEARSQFRRVLNDWFRRATAQVDAVHWHG